MYYAGRLSLVSVEGTEPISLALAKAHVRAEDLTNEDTKLTGLATAVREYFEEEWGRAIIASTWRLTIDRFPPYRREPIVMPRPPLQAITSIKYVDTDGVQQTWDQAEYVVRTYGGPAAMRGRVYPAPGYYWPITGAEPEAAEIEFTAGYPDGSVPQMQVGAMLLLLGDLFENREGRDVGVIASDNRTLARLSHRLRVPTMA